MTDKTLTEIYKEAKYIVSLPTGTCRLKVGEPSSKINKHLRAKGVKVAYFITPENPFSQNLCDAENELRHQRFKTILHKQSLEYLNGYGTDEDDIWGREVSYLIFSDDHEAMCSLAGHFGQKGILKIVLDRPVALLILDDLQYRELC